VVIIRHNDQANVPICSAPVSFADEIVVIDASSRGATADLLHKGGRRGLFWSLSWRSKQGPIGWSPLKRRRR
jgi:hypothetical protein